MNQVGWPLRALDERGADSPAAIGPHNLWCAPSYEAESVSLMQLIGERPSRATVVAHTAAVKGVIVGAAAGLLLLGAHRSLQVLARKRSRTRELNQLDSHSRILHE